MDDREGGDGTHSYGSPESAPISHVPEEIAEDILSYVREELARFGASGEPFIEYGLVILRTQSRTSQTQLGPWAPRWLQLDEPSRRQRDEPMQCTVVHHVPVLTTYRCKLCHHGQRQNGKHVIV